MDALVEEAPRPMIADFETGRRNLYKVQFDHYPQLLDIVQAMLYPAWHAVRALAIVAVV